MIWALVLHLVGDWLLQNDWMSRNKALRRPRAARHGDGLTSPPRMFTPSPRWWDRHPAAYVHAGIHGLLMLLIFPWWAALAIAAAHFVIDLRWPVQLWSVLIRQTQPRNDVAVRGGAIVGGQIEDAELTADGRTIVNKVRVRKGVSLLTTPLYDIGTEVRIWTDQVFHLVVVAVVALLAGS
jgi:hypothetical protein